MKFNLEGLDVVRARARSNERTMGCLATRRRARRGEATRTR